MVLIFDLPNFPRCLSGHRRRQIQNPRPRYENGFMFRDEILDVFLLSQVDGAGGGRRKTKRSGRSENVDPAAAAAPRATRSYIPVCAMTRDHGTKQQETKKFVAEIKKERDRESWRRHLSIKDGNRGESLTSVADLSDSVFADARFKPKSSAACSYFVTYQVPSIITGRLLCET